MQCDVYNSVSVLRAHLEKSRVYENVGYFPEQSGVWPRQLAIHLPGDHIRACNLRCAHCAGKLYPMVLGEWEEDLLNLLDKLKGAVFLHNYSGVYSEPLLNPFLVPLIEKTKQYSNVYGIKTNGSLLLGLEKKSGFMSKLCVLATSPDDYVSISLDAGYAKSFAKIKGVKQSVFHDVTEAIKLFGRLRGNNSFPALRATYLFTGQNDTCGEIDAAIKICAEAGFDSIKFSQATPVWSLGREANREWWSRIHKRDRELHRYFSKFFASEVGRAKVLYSSPQMFPSGGYRVCGYGYYQIALAEDGYVYRCSAASGSLFEDMRLGQITTDTSEFLEYVTKNQDIYFDTHKCFSRGAYCCRAAAAINDYYNEMC